MVYDNTGSLLVGMLMHASATACTIILWPVTSGVPLLTFDRVLAAVLWMAIALVALARGRQLSRTMLADAPKVAGNRPARL